LGEGSINRACCGGEGLGVGLHVVRIPSDDGVDAPTQSCLVEPRVDGVCGIIGDDGYGPRVALDESPGESLILALRSWQGIHKMIPP
jgi:hypothetical protein